MLRDDAADNAPAFIGAKNKSFVLLKGTTEGATKLVLLDRRLGSGLEGKTVGVENVIAKKFVSAAVEVIGAGFCDNVDHRTGVAAVFCVEGAGDNAKFLDAIR